MEIVIDIPEMLYEKIQNRKADKRTLETVILRGKPLPENHGRIIDESKITSVYYHEENYNRNTVRLYHTVIDGTDAPTIIEKFSTRGSK